MSRVPLTVKVDPDAARIYESASAGDREKLDRIISGQLLNYLTDDTTKGASEAFVDHEERRRRLGAVAGMWKDHTDLPTREELRDEWEERLERLGLGD